MHSAKKKTLKESKRTIFYFKFKKRETSRNNKMRLTCHREAGSPSEALLADPSPSPTPAATSLCPYLSVLGVQSLLLIAKQRTHTHSLARTLTHTHTHTHTHTRAHTHAHTHAHTNTPGGQGGAMVRISW